MKYIDDRILLAISSLKQVCITNEETASRLGITGKHLGQILKGEVQSFPPSTWKTMKTVLKPFLNEPVPDAVNEKYDVKYRIKSMSDRVQRLCVWLDTEAPEETRTAIFAVAKAGGFTNDNTNSLHSGREESPSAAGAA